MGNFSFLLASLNIKTQVLRTLYEFFPSVSLCQINNSRCSPVSQLNLVVKSGNLIPTMFCDFKVFS